MLASVLLRHKKRSGFTLIELIVVIAIIAIIIVAIFVALDAARRLIATRNARRAGDATAISDAISLRESERGKVSFVDDDPKTWQMIGTATECEQFCPYSMGLRTFNKGDNMTVTDSSAFDFELTDSFSISFWAPEYLSPYVVLGKSDAIKRGYTVITAKGILFFGLANNIAEASGAESKLTYGIANYPPNGTIHHLIVTYEGGNRTFQFFIDGESVTTTIVTQGPVNTIKNSASFAIGKYSSYLIAAPLNGQVDEVSIFNRALTEADAQNLYHGKYGAVSGLLARWTFDGDTGTTVTDVSGNGHDGTLMPSATEQDVSPEHVMMARPGVGTIPTCADAEAELKGEGFIPKIPFDPSLDASDGITGYAVNAAGSVIVRGCNAESIGAKDPPLIQENK